MKKIITILFLSLSLFSNAQNKSAKAEIEVDGVCNSCKVRIEKNAIGVKGVKFAQWSIDSHKLNIIIDERKTSVNEVQKAIAKAGHNNRLIDGSNEIISTDEDYEKVSDCCKYRDENAVKNHH